MGKNFGLTLAVVSVFACGGSGGYSTNPPKTTPPAGNTPPSSDGISVTNNAFSPASKTIMSGTSVQWAWNTCTGDGYSGEICVMHSVTFDDGVTSATQDKGTFSRTFAVAGTYAYHCMVHGAAMAGTITVQ